MLFSVSIVPMMSFLCEQKYFVYLIMSITPPKNFDTFDNNFLIVY